MKKDENINLTNVINNLRQRNKELLEKLEAKERELAEKPTEEEIEELKKGVNNKEDLTSFYEGMTGEIEQLWEHFRNYDEWTGRFTIGYGGENDVPTERWEVLTNLEVSIREILGNWKLKIMKNWKQAKWKWLKNLEI